MSDLDANNYWQRKATFERLNKIIPDFKELEKDGTKQYFDQSGNLHFEVKVSLNDHLESQFSKVIDYIHGERTSKPSSEILFHSNLYETSIHIGIALLDAYAQVTIGHGLNELTNSYNDVTLIDYKNEEVHRFKGSIGNEQLKYEVTHKLDEQLLSKSIAAVKYKRNEGTTKDFVGFLNKLSPEFEARFQHEKQSMEIN